MPRSQGCRHRLASTATCSAGWVTLYLALLATGDWTDFRDLAYGWSFSRALSHG